MKRSAFVRGCAVAILILFGSLRPSTAPAQIGTAFTYQGSLEFSGAPASGAHDFRFSLWDFSVFGTRIGPVLDYDTGAGGLGTLNVTDGLFSVSLDFGAGAFPGSERWLQIAVRPHDPSDTAPYTVLTPRVELKPVPYALFTPQARTAHTLSGPGGSPVDVVTADSGGFVGINTPAPSHRLTITQTADNETMRLVGGGLNGAGARFNFGDGDFVHITEDMDDRLVINASNRLALMSAAVGIGTTAPQTKLHVAGDLFVEERFYDSANSPGPADHILSSTGSGTRWVRPAGGGAAPPGSTRWIVLDWSDVSSQTAYTQVTLHNDSPQADTYSLQWRTDDNTLLATSVLPVPAHETRRGTSGSFSGPAATQNQFGHLVITAQSGTVENLLVRAIHIPGTSAGERLLSAFAR